jgi:hypothetical protein
MNRAMTRNLVEEYYSTGMQLSQPPPTIASSRSNSGSSGNSIRGPDGRTKARAVKGVPSKNISGSTSEGQMINDEIHTMLVHDDLTYDRQQGVLAVLSALVFKAVAL